MKGKYLIILFFLVLMGCANNKSIQRNDPNTQVSVDSSVILPFVIDHSLRIAEDMLRDSNLIVKEKIFEDIPNNPPSNIVIRVELNGKEIYPGTKIPKWSELTLIVQMNEVQIKNNQINL